MSAQGCRGISLLELLFVCAIALTLLGLGVSGFNQLIARSQQQTAIQTIVMSLDRARALSATRSIRVVFCNLSPEGICQSDWNQTQTGAFADINKNKVRDEDEEILFLLPWNPQSVNALWTNWLGDPVITYQPDGSVASNGTLQLRDQNNELFARLVINKVGRVRIEKP